MATSTSFVAHLGKIVPPSRGWKRLSSLADLEGTPGHGPSRPLVVVVHLSSAPIDWTDAMLRSMHAGQLRLAIASDKPSLSELLVLSDRPIAAYFNSYMADLHFQHMLRALQLGQRWFAPNLVQHALELARQASLVSADEVLNTLTEREREIALDVAAGYENRAIAHRRAITERTVKAHLTS
ncbi:MAG: response regulator transcription factor, partial [Gammaproteobacteria bacterium]|nr:response regulator transcription factor [Gammaproteobacteria bacterium]